MAPELKKGPAEAEPKDVPTKGIYLKLARANLLSAS
jgi:hypothetical protein